MNYKHLRYFKEVAELGSIAKASARLHLTPQTISTQLQLLQERFQAELFVKQGRNLVLTDAGRLALDYARDIFGMGAELEAAMRDRQQGRSRPLEFRVGIADAVPKSIACRLIDPALRLPQPVRLVCREWRLEHLLAELALHRLDLVIADSPLGPGTRVKAYSRLLGSTGLSVLAAPAVRKAHPQRFPKCLDGAPVLMPGGDTMTSESIRSWFDAVAVQPRVVGEFDDASLAFEFGRRGAGFFFGPSALAPDIEAQAGARVVGVAAEVRQAFYAISVERRVTNPCVMAISEAAHRLMSNDAPGAAPRRRAARGGA